MASKKDYKEMVDSLQEKLLNILEILEESQKTNENFSNEIDKLKEDLEYYKENYFRLLKEKEEKSKSRIRTFIEDKIKEHKKDEDEFFFYQS